MELKKQKHHQSQGDVLLEPRSGGSGALLPAPRQVTARTPAEILDMAGPQGAQMCSCSSPVFTEEPVKPRAHQSYGSRARSTR
jgi:hypothetical protein